MMKCFVIRLFYLLCHKYIYDNNSYNDKSWILREKTLDEKLMYIPSDDKHEEYDHLKKKISTAILNKLIKI